MIMNIFRSELFFFRGNVSTDGHEAAARFVVVPRKYTQIGNAPIMNDESCLSRQYCNIIIVFIVVVS